MKIYKSTFNKITDKMGLTNPVKKLELYANRAKLIDGYLKNNAKRGNFSEHKDTVQELKDMSASYEKELKALSKKTNSANPQLVLGAYKIDEIIKRHENAFKQSSESDFMRRGALQREHVDNQPKPVKTNVSAPKPAAPSIPIIEAKDQQTFVTFKFTPEQNLSTGEQMKQLYAAFEKLGIVDRVKAADIRIRNGYYEMKVRCTEAEKKPLTDKLAPFQEAFNPAAPEKRTPDPVNPVAAPIVQQPDKETYKERECYIKVTTTLDKATDMFNASIIVDRAIAAGEFPQYVDTTFKGNQVSVAIRCKESEYDSYIAKANKVAETLGENARVIGDSDMEKAKALRADPSRPSAVLGEQSVETPRPKM